MHEPQDLDKMQEIAKIVLTNWDSSGQTISSRMREHKADSTPESQKGKGKPYHYIAEWNPLLLAIYYNHMHIVKYFCEVVKVNLRSTLAMSKGGDHPLIFALASAIVRSESVLATEIFQYLYNKFDFVWDYKCLKQILVIVITYDRIDLLLFLLKSHTTHSLFLSFSYHFRIQFLSQFV